MEPWNAPENAEKSVEDELPGEWRTRTEFIVAHS